MKLSQLSTDRLVDVLCGITPYVENIITDDELIKELQTALDFAKANTRAEQLALVVSKFSKIIPILLKKKKYDLFGILATVNGKTVEQVAGQNIMVTLKEIKEMSSDTELVHFFKSWASMEESE